MANEDPLKNAITASAPAPVAAAPRWNRRAVWPLILFVPVVMVGGYLWWQFAPQNGLAEDQDHVDPHHKVDHAPRPLFVGWGTPDVALILSGQMKGYVQPCGCSDPQYGGLTRRYNFIKSLEAKKWHVVGVELGDMAYTKGPHDQALLKYVTAMRALKLMPYIGVGVGKSEFDLSLRDVAGQLLNPPGPTPPLVSANLLLPFPGVVVPHEVADRVSPRVGVVSLVTKSLRDVLEKAQHPDAKFNVAGAKVFEDSLKALADKKVELGVLLVQGKEFDPFKEKTDEALEEAKVCVKLAADLRKAKPGLAPIQVVLHVTDQAEPPGAPTWIVKDPRNPNDKTGLITLGHKGKHVGVLGVFRNRAGGFDYKYELVPMGPEYETPHDKDLEKRHPLMALMEEYSQRVKSENLIDQFGRAAHPTQVFGNGKFKDAYYIGSERCGDCHVGAYNIWEKPAWANPKNPHHHAVAFETLSKATRPSLRQHDGECVVCHTVGFEYNTGFNDKAFSANFKQKSPKKFEARELTLKAVGCESCHGPGSAHERSEMAKDRDRPELRLLMNPWKSVAPAQRMMKINDFCQKCHDTENDVHWDFKKAWPKVMHPNIPVNPAALAPVIQAPAVNRKDQPPPSGLIIEPYKGEGKQ